MQAMARLTIAQADFHRHWGGQAEVVLALSKALVQRGHRVIVISPPTKETAGKIEVADLAARAKEAGLEHFSGCNFRKGFRPLAFLNDLKTLGGVLKKEGVQVYHCHGSQDHWIGALAINRNGLNTQLVRTRHNIYPVKNHTANRWLFQKHTDQVITIFGDQKKFLTENGLLNDEKILTLHSPLPQEFVNPPGIARTVRDELKITPETPLVGFVANFHPDKAPLDFIEMAARVAKALPQVHFAMAGHGPLDVPIREKLKTLEFGERFHMLGFRKDMINVMASFDLVVLTSVTREASSTVLKQAGAMGVPSVATDVGGTREVVTDQKTGLIVKPGDVEACMAAVLSLLNNRARASEMGAAAKQKVLGEFTALAIAERTEELYFRLLNRDNADSSLNQPVLTAKS
jgi:glycosyltransferase involved in cell wall biosynthesis